MLHWITLTHTYISLSYVMRFFLVMDVSSKMCTYTSIVFATQPAMDEMGNDTFLEPIVKSPTESRMVGDKHR